MMLSLTPLIISLLSTVIIGSEVLYKRMKNTRFLYDNGGDNGTHVRSLMHCNSLCTTISACNGINFDHNSNTCYFLNQTIISDKIPSVVETTGGWSHLYEEPDADAVARDCTEWFTNGVVHDGTYLINPPGSPHPFSVCCHNGSTVIQNRSTGNLTFNRNWDDYKNGFGSLDDEFWLGNDRIHYLSSSGQYAVHFELMHPDGKWYTATYNAFSVAAETDNYRLSVGDFTGGNASDSINLNLQLTPNGVEFSTYNADNDNSPAKCTNGIDDQHGGWWYNNCSAVLLNGEYSTDGNLHIPPEKVTGIMWNTLSFYNLYNNDYSSMMKTRVKLTRVG